MAQTEMTSGTQKHSEVTDTRTTMASRTESKVQSTTVTVQERGVAEVSREKEQERARRRFVNTAFRVGRGIQRIHRIIDSNAQNGDDGGMEDDDNDSDDSDRYTDSDRYDSDDDDADHHHDAADDDEKLDEMHDDDEEMDNATTSDNASTHHDASNHGADHPANLSSSAFATSAGRGGARDASTPKMNLVPEKPVSTDAAKPTANHTSKQQNSISGQTISSSKDQAATSPAKEAQAGSGQLQSTPTGQTPSNSVPTQNVPYQPNESNATPNTVQKTPKPDPLAPTAKAPYGYKLVKVRKPDGTVVQVKRPLKAEEAPQTPRLPLHQEAQSSDRFSTVHAMVTTGSAAAEERNREPDNQSQHPVPVSSAGLVGTAVTASSQEQEKLKTNPQDDSRSAAVSRPVPNTGLKDKLAVEVNEKEIVADEKNEHVQHPISKTALRTRRVARILQIASWIIMVLFPVLFLGLGIAALELNNHPIGSSAKLVQAKDVAISLWPVVFAAVVAQTLKAYAAYKVERGIKLITLEQLMSSPSLAGAIKQPFILRTFNWTTIFLFLIWGLSPLANQALVRMVYTEELDTPQQQQVQYFQPQSLLSNATEFAYLQGGDLGDITEINAMYTSLIIGSNSSRAANQDFWTNLKIPLYNPVNAPVPAGFSSLLGIPVSIPPNSQESPSQSALNRVFTITTTYFRLNCTDLVSVNSSDPAIAQLNLTASVSTTLLLAAENNTQQLFITPPMPSHPGFTTQYGSPGPQGTIHFAINDTQYYSREAATQSDYFAPEYNDMLLYSRCPYDQVMMDSKVSCFGGGALANCEVIDQALRTPASGDLAPLGYYFMEAMLRVGMNPNTNFQMWGETEQYVYNPSFAALGASNSSVLTTSSDFVGFQGTKLSRNFGQLVNTLWLASTKHKLFLGGDLMALYQDSWYGWTVSNTTATVSGFNVTSYVADRVWCAILIVCSVILLLVAVAAAIFESRTVGPDFLGFANTSIRRGVKLPRRMNQLSASDRLDALRECEILLQDVRPGDAEMGKIALGVREENSVPLVLGRNYR